MIIMCAIRLSGKGLLATSSTIRSMQVWLRMGAAGGTGNVAQKWDNLANCTSKEFAMLKGDNLLNCPTKEFAMLKWDNLLNCPTKEFAMLKWDNLPNCPTKEFAMLKWDNLPNCPTKEFALVKWDNLPNCPTHQRSITAESGSNNPASRSIRHASLRRLRLTGKR